MHTANGLNGLKINPVLKALTPAVSTLDDLYVVPGSPCDALGNVRVCNTSGGTQTFSIGWTTQSQTTVTYWEYGTTIEAGCSLDLFAEDKWLPSTTTVWVSSDGGGVSFTWQGSECASETATPAFTGS